MRYILILLFGIITQVMAQQHTVSSFSPTVAGPNELLTITGTGFVSSGMTVSLGSATITSYTFVSATTIRVTVSSSSTSGNIRVTKTGFTDRQLPGFIFREPVTQFIGDFGGYWSSSSTSINATKPNNTNNMLAFRYGGALISTGVNDAVLTANGQTFVAGNYKGLPVNMSGTTCPTSATSCNGGNPTLIVVGAAADGNVTSAVRTHASIKDLTVRSVLTDGSNGLDISTGYTNLTVGSVSTYVVRFIDATGINDNIPDILVTQIAEPTGTTIDRYEFLDSLGQLVGRALGTLDLSTVARVGQHQCDLFTVPDYTSFNTAKPNGVSSAAATRDMRLVGFRLSDFGITQSNYLTVHTLKITASGKSDVGFVAYNANTIYSTPLIEVSESTDSIACAGQSAFVSMDVTLPGETMTYQWEMRVSPSSAWGAIPGATGSSYSITAPTYYSQYRLSVNTNGRTSYSPIVTITGCLPVELSYFKAQQTEDGNVLQWSTKSENNSSHFTVLWSNDGYVWINISNLPAAGYSTEDIYYSTVHQSPSACKYNYYRLDQYDKNGEHVTYGPISVDNLCEKRVVRVINMLGQEIHELQSGLMIAIYDDGSVKKIVKQ